MSKPRIILAGAALFVTLICWSLSSPMNSHADEKFHFASILCADGFNQRCSKNIKSDEGLQTLLLNVNVCTPRNSQNTNNKRILIPRINNQCRYENSTSEPLSKMTQSPNFFHETNSAISAFIAEGEKPTIYYKTLNIFASGNAAESIVQMRIFNSVIFSLLLIIFLLSSNGALQFGGLIGILSTLIPHGLFLVSGINDISWSYTGCSLSWAFLLVILNRPVQIAWKTYFATFGWIASNLIVFFSRIDTAIILIFTNIAILAFKLVEISKRPRINLSGLFSVCTLLLIYTWIKVPALSQTVLPTSESSNGFQDLIIVFGNAVKLSIAMPMRIWGLQAPGWGPLEADSDVFLPNLMFFAFTAVYLIRKSQIRQKTFAFLSYGFLFCVFLIQCYVRRDWTTPFYLIRTGWANDKFSARYFIPIFPFFFGTLALNSKGIYQIFYSAKFRISLIIILSFGQTLTIYNIGNTFRTHPSWYWQNFPIGIGAIFLVGSCAFTAFLFLALTYPVKYLSGNLASELKSM